MSAGDNLVITLPDSEAELKASVEPAPSAGKSLTFLGRTGVFSPSFPQTIDLIHPFNIPQQEMAEVYCFSINSVGV